MEERQNFDVSLMGSVDYDKWSLGDDQLAGAFPAPSAPHSRINAEPLDRPLDTGYHDLRTDGVVRFKIIAHSSKVANRLL